MLKKRIAQTSGESSGCATPATFPRKKVVADE
jgi:hypothetical protein